MPDTLYRIIAWTLGEYSYLGDLTPEQVNQSIKQKIKYARALPATSLPNRQTCQPSKKKKNKYKKALVIFLCGLLTPRSEQKKRMYI